MQQAESINIESFRKIRDIKSTSNEKWLLVENPITSKKYIQIIFDQNINQLDLTKITKISTHPSILTIVNHIEQPTPSITMEYHNKITLAEYISKNSYGIKK